MVKRGPSDVRHSDQALRLTRPRARVLELLQQEAPLTADEVAGRFDQHVNTARLHLDFLVDSGLAVRSREAGSRRGRPPWTYRPSPDVVEPDARVREYGALVDALAGHLMRTSPAPPSEAHAAGLEWGRREAWRRQLPEAHGAAARRGVVEVLASMGFSPEADPRVTNVRLTACPLLDAARRHPEVVCHVHEGFVAGLLEAMGSDPASAQLMPFSHVGSCRLRLDVARPARPS